MSRKNDDPMNREGGARVDAQPDAEAKIRSQLPGNPAVDGSSGAHSDRIGSRGAEDDRKAAEGSGDTEQSHRERS
ncbi:MULTISPECIES: hypothetical protein [Microvirga]|uniref:hypothetical protein n=1 Tax=Microvirga TaxID=186650 RepID=UPI001D0012D5|nr:hypothetical protein [Microvirga lenta]MCB5174928.1 hypothetical protein [Microvirga lenta]